MTRKSKPNAPIVMGDYTAYAVRGPNADGAYYWSAKWWTDSAKGRTRTSKVLGWLTRADATEEVRKLSGSENPDDYARSGEVRTVRDLMETWLAVVETSSKKAPTKHTIRWVAARIARELGDHRLDRLDLDALDAYIARRLDEDGAPKSSLRIEMVYLGAAWTWAYRRGFVTIPKFVKPSIRETGRVYRDGTPEPADVARVRAALDERGEADPHEAEFAMGHRLIWATGCRPHEIHRLTWAGVDLAGAEITVPDDTKTGTRGIPLRSETVRQPREWSLRCGHSRPEDPVVQVGNLTHGINHRLVGQAETRKGRAPRPGICSKLGIPEYTCGGLRRLAVDALYASARESKVDVGTVASIMGHSPATALRHYRNPSKKDKRAAIVAAGLGTVPVAEAVVIEFPVDKKG